MPASADGVHRHAAFPALKDNLLSLREAGTPTKLSPAVDSALIQDACGITLGIDFVACSSQ